MRRPVVFTVVWKKVKLTNGTISSLKFFTWYSKISYKSIYISCISPFVNMVTTTQVLTSKRALLLIEHLGFFSWCLCYIVRGPYDDYSKLVWTVTQKPVIMQFIYACLSHTRVQDLKVDQQNQIPKSSQMFKQQHCCRIICNWVFTFTSCFHFVLVFHILCF